MANSNIQVTWGFPSLANRMDTSCASAHVYRQALQWKGVRTPGSIQCTAEPVVARPPKTFHETMCRWGTRKSTAGKTVAQRGSLSQVTTPCPQYPCPLYSLQVLPAESLSERGPSFCVGDEGAANPGTFLATAEPVFLSWPPCSKAFFE
jgi:hypothetical protein